MANSQEQRDFLDFTIDCGALRFGDFMLKSGRASPYFFNTGCFSDGEKLLRLGEFYATVIRSSGIVFDMLFGSAYKGIPLVASTAMALSRGASRAVPFCFDRKERKNHGDAGEIVGNPLSGRVLIVDDVLSAGTSARQASALISSAGADPVGLVVALDRRECGERINAAEELSRAGLSFLYITNLDGIVAYLAENPRMSQALSRIRDYRHQYGTVVEAAST